MQKEMIVEVLLNSRIIDLVMNLKVIKKQKTKLKKIKRLIYVRNIDSIFNKREPI